MRSKAFYLLLLLLMMKIQRPAPPVIGRGGLASVSRLGLCRTEITNAGASAIAAACANARSRLRQIRFGPGVDGSTVIAAVAPLHAAPVRWISVHYGPYGGQGACCVLIPGGAPA